MSSPEPVAPVSFAEALDQLGFAEPDRLNPGAWDAAQAACPGAPLPFLTEGFLDEALRYIRADAGMRAAFHAAAARVRATPAAARMAWHGHHQMFIAADGLKRFALESPALGEHGGMLTALVALSGLPRIRELHRARGIPDAVTVETMSDLGIWMRHYRERNGRWGLRELRWLMHHFRGHLVRLGRLQFKPSLLWPETGWEPALHQGDRVLEIHIPAEDPLDEAACVDSCRRAREFFPRYYSELPFRAITCVAWLLDPVYREILPPTANLVRFQSHFDLRRVEADEGLAFERVFGGPRPDDLSGLPRDTALRRAILDHYARGGRPLAEGAGIWRDS